MGIFEGQIDDGAVTESKLDAAAQSKLNAGTNPADVSQVEAEAGVETANRSWSPERVGQAIAALQTPESFTSGAHDGDDHTGVTAIAPPDQPEAEAGAATTPRLWTAERVGQAVAALAPPEAFDATAHTNANHAGLPGVPGINNFGVGSWGLLVPDPSGGLVPPIASGVFGNPDHSQGLSRSIGAGSLGGFVGAFGGFDAGLGSPPGSQGGVKLGKGFHKTAYGRLIGLFQPQGGQGCRVFFGFGQTTATLSNMISSDSPPVDYVGFQFSGTGLRGDTTWQAVRRDSVQNISDTGVAFGTTNFFVIDFIPTGNFNEADARMRIWAVNSNLAPAIFGNNPWPTPDFDQTYPNAQLPGDFMSVWAAVEYQADSNRIEYTSFSYQQWANISAFPVP